MRMGTPLDGEGLAALSAQVGDLRADLRTVKARVESGAIPVHGLTELRHRVDELAQAVTDLLADEPAPRVAAPYWIDLDPADRDVALGELTWWVDKVLAVNYPHCALLPCWAAHPAAVWELSTLRAEWLRVYVRKYPELDGALTWHERRLPGVVERLQKVLSDCTKAGCDLARRASPL